jgi:hypothetical protein
MPVYYVPSCYTNNSTSTTTTIPWWLYSSNSLTTATTTTLTTNTYYYYVAADSRSLYPAMEAPVFIAPERIVAPHIIRQTEDELYRIERRRQRLELERQERLAKERAMELLLSHLTPQQRETFEANKWFIVEGGLSKKRYRINMKGHLVANIDALDDGHRLCAHADLHSVPMGDHLLAQKLMLQYDEERFLRIANRHRAA